MDRWTQTELFVRIARLGSISKAAEDLGLSNAAASRYLSTLEKRLGARLVERTTRRLWLTEAGRTYLKHCEAALSMLGEGDAAVNEAATEPVGELRVTSSVSFTLNHIGPALPELYRRFPRLRLHVVAENKFPSFIEAGIDVAIRTRQFEPDSGITVRKLAETRLVIAAAPEYLARRGVPAGVEDIPSHDLLIYTLATQTSELRLKRGDETRVIPITGCFSCNEGQVIRAAALAGAGILIQPLYIILDDIQAGRLVPLFEDWSLPMLTINLAYQSRQHQPAKIRAFSDFMYERLARLDLTQRWRPLPGLPA